MGKQLQRRIDLVLGERCITCRQEVIKLNLI